MVSENVQGSRYASRTVWMLAGVAALTVLTVIVVRPWKSSGGSSSDAALQNVQAAGTVTVSIPVEGMICFLCASSVKRTAQGVEGVHAAEVDLARKRATISYVEGKTSPAHIATAIARLGYKTGPPVIEKSQ